MKTRRHFLQKASLGFLGLPALPFLPSSSPQTISIRGLNRIKNDDILFKLVRESLLLPKEMVYLNTGSLGPSPRQIVDEVSSAMHELESNPVINNWCEFGEKMEAVSKKMAGFIGEEEDEIIDENLDILRRKGWYHGYLNFAAFIATHAAVSK